MNNLIRFIGMIIGLSFSFFVVAEHSSHASTTTTGTDLVLLSEVSWTPLNPARGSKSPQAGTLWGNRTSAGPSGFLVKFTQGFSSPPHIHNVSYRVTNTIPLLSVAGYLLVPFGHSQRARRTSPRQKGQATLRILKLIAALTL